MSSKDKKKIKMLLISNMYPTDKDQYYGIFVNNFVENFTNTDVNIVSKSLIYGRGKGGVQKLQKYFFFYLSIVKNLLQYRYDLIYVHYPSYSSLPILFCLPFIKEPIILNFHGSDVMAKSNFSKFLHLLLQPVIQKSKVIVVPSTYFKDLVSKKLNVKKSKIFVSPSGGIDTKVFKPSGEKKTYDSFVVGYVGRIDQGKGWDDLLKSCALLKNEISNLECRIIGDGSQATELAYLINQLDISEITNYIGSVTHKDLFLYYNSLDLFIFPTKLKESLGLVGIEALSCGIPVVASNIGGLTDYVAEDRNGVFFEPGNPEDLAKKILRLYTNKILTKQLKAAARESIKAYDKQIVSHKLIEKLEQICNTHE